MTGLAWIEGRRRWQFRSELWVTGVRHRGAGRSGKIEALGPGIWPICTEEEPSAGCCSPCPATEPQRRELAAGMSAHVLWVSLPPLLAPPSHKPNPLNSTSETRQGAWGPISRMDGWEGEKKAVPILVNLFKSKKKKKLPHGHTSGQQTPRGRCVRRPRARSCSWLLRVRKEQRRALGGHAPRKR